MTFTSSKDKKESIKKLGADRVVVKQEAGKFDVVLNTLPSSDDFHQYLGLTAPLGTFIQLGVPAFSKPAQINPASMIFGHLNFTGSSVGSRKGAQEMLDFSAKHNIVPLSEEFDYEHFPQAFDRLENGKPTFRCVVGATHTHKH